MANMIKDYYGSMYGNYRHRTFTDIYEDYSTFAIDYRGIGIPALLKDRTIQTLYYLLYSRHADDPIASDNETKFKYQLFSIIWQYGPTWEKRLEIQDTIRNLKEDELLTGSRQIYNHANNPSTEPGTDTTDELAYINDQNVTKNSKAKLDAYAMQYEVIKNDVTDNFLHQFDKLFQKCVEPELPLWYVSED